MRDESECRQCRDKDREITAQREVITNHRRDLKTLRQKVLELQEALREMCDYAEVCKHSPARPHLEAAEPRSRW